MIANGPRCRYNGGVARQKCPEGPWNGVVPNRQSRSFPVMTESILPFENAPANPEIYPGIRLGTYLVQRKIAFGGMATVWLARHEPLDRLVALKILRAEFTADPRNILRFTREARSAARLDSPAIVRIYEVGSFPRRRPFGARFFPFLFGKGARPLYYIAQEYLPGMNLAQYVRRRGPLSVRQALTVTAAVARALETADRAGVVHRDIKPENILVSESGEIKVADFGLAFSAEERQENDLSLTISGVTLGTPLYMSPEQGEGKKTDVRSDLYSLGAALFWMLTGRPLPRDPKGVCNEIKQKTGISCMIIDANDFTRDILGSSDDVKLSEDELCEIIRDNPAGQDDQCTPFILIRKK